MSEKTYPASFKAIYVEKASRLELLIRIPYGIFIGIIQWAWGIAAAICGLIQWFYILVTGRRHRGLWDFVVQFTRFSVRATAYFTMLTDKRPPVSGEELPLPEQPPPPPPP